MENKTIRSQADVLIVGGGFAGLIAANKIKENNPELDVLVAERATVGCAGKANKGAGILMYFPEDGDIDEYCDYVVSELGMYLNDQEILPKFCKATQVMCEDLERWGCKYERDPEFDDELITFSIDAGERWMLRMIDHDMMEQLVKSGRKLGVKYINKLQIVDYLTREGKVIGAVGFDIVTGDYHVINAKSTVAATGSCGYMYAYMWKSARGDGIAAAYRAGAQLRNCEFGNFYNMANEGNYYCIVGPGTMFCYKNNQGCDIGPKYADRNEPDFSAQFYYGIENEIKNGYGPIRLVPEKFLELPGTENRPWHKKFEEYSHGKEVKYALNKDDPNPICVPYFLGEMSSVRVDHDMRTTLPGLWALGDTCYSGSGTVGALPTPGRMRGSGLGFAGASAEMCAKTVAEYAASAELVQPDEAQVEALKDRMFAPLNREGGADPRDVIYDLQCAVAPPYFSLSKTEARIDEALGMVKKIIDDAGNSNAGGDLHKLGLCHDAINMSMLAKLYFAAARERQESRGFHYREDYPHLDNLNWLKWSVFKRVDGEDVLTWEDVPIDDYDVQPPM